MPATLPRRSYTDDERVALITARLLMRRPYTGDDARRFDEVCRELLDQQTNRRPPMPRNVRQMLDPSDPL